MAIAVTVTVIVALTARAFGRVDGPPGMAPAIRAGLVVLLVAQAVGGAMIGTGLVALEEPGVASTTFGAAGIMKVPHAVGMHAVQVLPGLAWLLTFTGLAAQRRVRLVEMAALGYGGLVAVSALQTLRGLAPWDLGLVTAALLAISAGLLGIALVFALTALVRPAPAPV